MKPRSWMRLRSCRVPYCRRCCVGQGTAIHRFRVCYHLPCCRSSRHHRATICRYLIFIWEASPSRGWKKPWTWSSSVTLITILLALCTCIAFIYHVIFIFSHSYYINKKFLCCCRSEMHFWYRLRTDAAGSSYSASCPRQREGTTTAVTKSHGANRILGHAQVR